VIGRAARVLIWASVALLACSACLGVATAQTADASAIPPAVGVGGGLGAIGGGVGGLLWFAGKLSDGLALLREVRDSLGKLVLLGQDHGEALEDVEDLVGSVLGTVSKGNPADAPVGAGTWLERQQARRSDRRDRRRRIAEPRTV
jgi:hypothetical protein